MGTIFILGNGFDIQCGLESRYSDFFRWCGLTYPWYKQAASIDPKNEQVFDTFYRVAAEKPEFTVWDLYFLIHSERIKSDFWCDVESEISDSIKMDYWKDLLAEINYFFANHSWRNTNSEWRVKKWYCAGLLMRKYFPDDFSQAPRIYVNRSRVISKKELILALRKELTIFEDRFALYLSSEVDRTKNEYPGKQRLMLEQLVDSTVREKPFYAFSFNYTDTLDLLEGNILLSQNVHGSLKTHPIFGISSKSNDNEDYNQFSKSNRRLENDMPVISRLVQDRDKDFHVIFYGLSLNEADYDYYKIILDSVKKNTIFFCYSNYGGVNRKQDSINSAKKMIEKVTDWDFYEQVEREKIKIVEVISPFLQDKV
jgi:hypothetical protein